MDISQLPLALPRRTLRLFGRYWLPLVVFFLIGKGAHDLLAEAAAHVNRHIPVFAFSLLAIAILCSLTAYVLMFLSVHGGLPTVWAIHETEGRLDPRVAEARMRGIRDAAKTVSLTLMPFLIVYAAWQLFEDDIRNMEYRTWEINPLTASPSLQDFTMWFAVAGVVAYLLRVAFERITRVSGNAVTGVLMAVCEANWMFFGILGISKLGKGALAWLSDTIAWQNLKPQIDDMGSVAAVFPLHLNNAISALTGDFGWASVITPDLKDGIALPLAWLAITGVAYSREMEDVRELVLSSRRGQALAARAESAPNVIKRWAKLPSGIRDKYVPPLHCMWLMIGSGIPFFLMFCVFYSGLELLSNVGQQVVTTVIGPESAGLFWQELNPALGVAVQTVFESLRICLLAATFDLALSRFSARSASSTDPTYSSRASAAARVFDSPAR